MARKRWEGTSAEERRQHAAFMASHREYAPPDPTKPRCTCGAMTLADPKAEGLGHKPQCTFYQRQPKIKAATGNTGK
jgi:hypothetical protein